ncbi:MAG TPA: aspartate ammonia-lyase [Methanomicrobiales archaeon]|nr:aspartate ammonia-lyase [Methanomicrobiales archaeon]
MRQEKDSLGMRDVPEEVYYGIQTLRAVENFPVTGRREPPELVKAYALLKQAAALANMDLGVLDRPRGEAIASAAAEVASGKLADQFPVDIFQAGAGTSFNMNVNEVIANRALESLGRRKGEYEFLSPNDHVNLSQSSNDTFPTASHLAVIGEADRLLLRLRELVQALERKGREFQTLPKTGRTHLMDALPVTLGDEFQAYATALARGSVRIRERRDALRELAIGGTATGTGAGAPPGFRDAVVGHLSRLTGLPLFSALDSLEALQSRSQMAAFSGALRELALELIRIANDLRIMGSGPTSGLDEIHLPPVQPGSSIMPGKVNPVMAECLDMVAFQVIGNDTALSLAAQAGQFELNVMTPLMTHTLLDSLGMLNRYLPAFTERCIDGIQANEVRLVAYIRLNPSLATLLTPRIGYLRAARLAEESMEKKRSVRDLAIEKGILTEKEADALFDLEDQSRNRYRDERM